MQVTGCVLGRMSRAHPAARVGRPRPQPARAAAPLDAEPGR